VKIYGIIAINNLKRTGYGYGPEVWSEVVCGANERKTE
jgi:hypothetical protein